MIEKLDLPDYQKIELDGNLKEIWKHTIGMRM